MRLFMLKNNALHLEGKRKSIMEPSDTQKEWHTRGEINKIDLLCAKMIISKHEIMAI